MSRRGEAKGRLLPVPSARGSGSAASPSCGDTLECGRLEAGQNSGHLAAGIYRSPLPLRRGGGVIVAPCPLRQGVYFFVKWVLFFEFSVEKFMGIW